MNIAEFGCVVYEGEFLDLIEKMIVMIVACMVVFALIAKWFGKKAAEYLGIAFASYMTAEQLEKAGEELTAFAVGVKTPNWKPTCKRRATTSCAFSCRSVW